jgi:hypothetical protein
MLQSTLRIFSLFSALVLATAASAQYVEDFSSFPGGAGGPWVGPWSLVGNSPLGSLNAGLDSASPLSVGSGPPLSVGSGQYLSVKTSHSIGSGDNLQFGSFLNREYTSTPLLDLNTTHFLSFQFRIDDLIQKGQTQFGFEGMRDDRTLWNLVLGFPAISASDWLMTDGLGNGSALWVHTGILPQLGHVYQFDLTLRPQNSNYDAKLSDLTGGIFYAANSLDFSWQTNLGPTVTEEIWVRASTSSAAGDKINYSLDNIQLRAGAVPEPATYGWLAATALFAVILSRRTRSAYSR